MVLRLLQRLRVCRVGDARHSTFTFNYSGSKRGNAKTSASLIQSVLSIVKQTWLMSTHVYPQLLTDA